MSYNCFKRINISQSLNDYSTEGLKSNLHRIHSKWQKYGLSLKKKTYYDPSIASTFEVSDEVKSEVLSIIPKDLLDIEVPHVWYLEVSGSEDDTTMVPPHIDDFRVCTINYYINTNDETTFFYEYKSGIMEEIESFSAKMNQFWVLNTTIPHSVKLVPNKTRKMIGASFIETPFEKVISFFP